jgi:hypothetical protein
MYKRCALNVYVWVKVHLHPLSLARPPLWTWMAVVFAVSGFSLKDLDIYDIMYKPRPK